MKRWLLALAWLLATAAFVCSQQPHAGRPHPAGDAPASLLPGLGTHHHPVATKNVTAQRFFDQGLTLVYAFNHEEAARLFRRAAELDPRLAMAYWGIAYALGPNINLDVAPAREQAAYAAVQQAQALAAHAPANERAYIAALAQRYAIAPQADLKQLAANYKQAMGALLRQAVSNEDALAYDEPPPWFIPTRKTLGALLLRTGNAAEAEQVFRADLIQHPHSGRSLFGLRESLKAQGKLRAAQMAQREFVRAWQHADTRLTIADL